MKTGSAPFLSLGLALGFLCPTTVTADETGYALAGGKLPPAGTVLERKVTVETNGRAALKKGEDSTDGTYNRKESETRKINILAEDKYSEQLTETQLSGELALGERKFPSREQPNPLLNTVVIAQKEGEEWVPKLQDGTPLPAEQVAKWARSSFSSSFKKQLSLFGTEPRKPGDKWQVDASTLPQFAGVPHPKGEISCEFVEIKDGDSGKVAVLKMAFNLQGEVPEVKPGEKMPTHISHLIGQITQLQSLDYQISLDIDIRGSVEIDGTIGDGELKILSPITISEKTTLQKP